MLHVCPDFPGANGDLKIFVHRERDEDAPSLRHEADARLADSVSGQSRDVDSIDDDAPASGRCQTRQRSTERRLTHAIAAENRSHLAAFGAETRPLQHVAITVVRVNVDEFEHREL